MIELTDLHIDGKKNETTISHVNVMWLNVMSSCIATWLLIPIYLPVTDGDRVLVVDVIVFVVTVYVVVTGIGQENA